MATNLKLAFGGGDSKKISFSFPCANVGAPAVQVKILMQAIVANGDIYAEVPLSFSKAEFYVSDVIPIDIG